LIELLQNLNKAGKTIIMITHNHDYLSYADKILFMHDGKINKEIIVKDYDIESIKKDLLFNIENFKNSSTDNKYVPKHIALSTQESIKEK